MAGSFNQGGSGGPGPQQFPQQGAPGQPTAVAQNHTSGPSKKWLWLLAIPVGFFLIIAILLGGCIYVFAQIASEPIDATNAYFTALEQEDYADAYERLCQQEQDRVPFAEWQTMVEQDNITSFDFTGSSAQNDMATVKGTIEIDGATESASYDLVREEDEWRVC